MKESSDHEFELKTDPSEGCSVSECETVDSEPIISSEEEESDESNEEKQRYSYFIVERIVAETRNKTELKRYIREKGLDGKIIRGKIINTTAKVRTEIIIN